MIEDVFDPEQFERQGDNKDVVRRIAALNDMKSVLQIDPPRVKELPKQRGGVFAPVTEQVITILRMGVPVDMNPLDDFMPSLIALAPRTQDGHFVAVLVQRT